MAKKIREDPSNLTDEQVLAEFVKRFQCDAAILIYRDGDYHHAFWKWVNKDGKQWADHVMNLIKQRDEERGMIVTPNQD